MNEMQVEEQNNIQNMKVNFQNLKKIIITGCVIGVVGITGTIVALNNRSKNYRDVTLATILQNVEDDSYIDELIQSYDPDIVQKIDELATLISLSERLNKLNIKGDNDIIDEPSSLDDIDVIKVNEMIEKYQILSHDTRIQKKVLNAEYLEYLSLKSELGINEREINNYLRTTAQSDLINYAKFCISAKLLDVNGNIPMDFEQPNIILKRGYHCYKIEYIIFDNSELYKIQKGYIPADRYCLYDICDMINYGIIEEGTGTVSGYNKRYNKQLLSIINDLKRISNLDSTITKNNNIEINTSSRNAQAYQKKLQNKDHH